MPGFLRATLTVLAAVLSFVPQWLPAADRGVVWPSDALPPMSVSTRWENGPEDSPHLNFVLQGQDIEIDFGTMQPFVLPSATDPRPDVPGSLVFRDTRVPDGWLCLTLFDKGSFLSSVSEENLKTYLDGLSNACDPAKGQSVTVLQTPGEIERKDVLLGTRPLYATWRYQDLPHHIDYTRSDYFFLLADGRLLVASIVTDTSNHDGVRSAALDVLRSGSFAK